MRLANYVTHGATSTSKPKEYCETYHTVLDSMERTTDAQAEPLSLAQMEEFGGQLRIVLEIRHLQPVPPSKAKPFPDKVAPATNAATDDQEGIMVRLRKLEDLPPKAPTGRGGRGGCGGRTAGRGGATRGGGKPLAQFRCLYCGTLGCVPSKCPHGNEEARRE